MNKHRNPKEWLSITGSIASLVGLMLALFTVYSKAAGFHPQLAVWSVAFCLVCLLCVGATILYASDYIIEVSKRDIPQREKILRWLGTSVAAILISAIFIDGIFAALTWNWWGLYILTYLYIWLS
ncbi:MAG: hypothetical protein AAGH72_06610 [Verrucomicrobiota bacterium]